jgi:hypothetical protein
MAQPSSWIMALGMRYYRETEAQMSATPSPTQQFLADALSTEPLSEEAPYIHPADLENGEFTNGQPSSGKRAWLTFVGFLIAAGIGMVAALAWKSDGDAAKETIAPAASLKEISPDLEVIRQSIDALATSTATNQAQMMRSIDQLAAGQGHMTREITEMQTVERYILDKISTPTAAVPKPALRPSQALTAVNPAKSP